MRQLRGLALTLAMLAVAALGWIFLVRWRWPYDLEWMEGGMLCHALRLDAGQSLYAPPSVEFVPYLYTPLYPWLVALFGKLGAIGYGLGRGLSIASYSLACLLGYVFVRREGGSRAAAFVALALPAAAFVPTGAWYDLARPDSLFLLLVTAGLLVGWWGRYRVGGAVGAALLLIAAFFTKQTATPFMAALGLFLLLASPRMALVYGGTLASVGLPLLWLTNRATDGWFWTYVFELHQKHDFYAVRAFVASPVRLLLLVGPALLLVPWALVRRPSPGLVFALVLGAAGAGAACVGFGTQWAFTNAFVPGVFFLSILVGVAAGRLVTPPSATERPVDTRRAVQPPMRVPEGRQALVWLLLTLSVAAAPGGLVRLVAGVVPHGWGFGAEGGRPSMGYDPRAYLPTAAERLKGDALLERLRKTPGDVLIPFHPFYGHLAGKRTWLHRMGVLDVGRAGLGVPKGLAEALVQHRFSLVLMDDKIDGNWDYWPGLLRAYHKSETLDGPPVFSGAVTRPRDLLVPTLGPAQGLLGGGEPAARPLPSPPRALPAPPSALPALAPGAAEGEEVRPAPARPSSAVGASR